MDEGEGRRGKREKERGKGGLGAGGGEREAEISNSPLPKIVENTVKTKKRKWKERGRRGGRGKEYEEKRRDMYIWDGGGEGRREVGKWENKKNLQSQKWRAT